jgi:hypothetical protein
MQPRNPIFRPTRTDVAMRDFVRFRTYCRSCPRCDCLVCEEGSVFERGSRGAFASCVLIVFAVAAPNGVCLHLPGGLPCIFFCREAARVRTPTRIATNNSSMPSWRSLNGENLNLLLRTGAPDDCRRKQHALACTLNRDLQRGISTTNQRRHSTKYRGILKQAPRARADCVVPQVPSRPSLATTRSHRRGRAH